MPGKLTEEVQTLVQRSGTNTGGMRTEAERASFAANVRKDIAAIVYQLNTVHKTLVEVLSSEEGLNALEFGLSGNIMYTHIQATEADADAYWSDDQARARTIKETIDVLLSEIDRLENELQQALDNNEYDDTDVRALIAANDLDLEQLAKDSMGPNYSLDGDGEANLTYSLSQALDALGAFFTNFPGTGNTYATTYPTITLTVNLSDINIDTTLAQATITGLPTDLANIRTFIGMNDSADTGPDYTPDGGAGPLKVVANGDPLETAIYKLDQASGGVELEIGHTAIYAHDWNKTFAAAGPSIGLTEWAVPNTMVLRTLDFDDQVQEEAYATVPIPQDENGDRPTRFKVIAHMVLKPVGGYPGGAGVMMGISSSSIPGINPVGNKTIINPGWQGNVGVSQTGLTAGNQDNLLVFEFATTTLASNPLGLLNLRLSRLVGDVADDWGDDVGLIVAHVVWYR